MAIRNRIVEHLTVRAGDLVPHPDNFRTHSNRQRAALRASYDEVGFARSLLGYRLPDGRIQLIDGHLRRDVTPDLPVTVEVLDVTAEEARQLLLTLDPLAALAGNDATLLAELTSRVESASDALNEFWKSLAAEAAAPPLPPAGETGGEPPAADQFLVLIRCANESQQVELLGRFQAEGLECKALVG